MMDNMEMLKTLIGGKCPTCSSDFVLGLGMMSPQALFVLTPAMLEMKKATLIEAIKGSSLSEEQKTGLLSQYADPKMMIDPTTADVMLEELRTKYAVSKPGETKAAPKKKANGTPAA